MLTRTVETTRTTTSKATTDSKPTKEWSASASDETGVVRDPKGGSGGSGGG